MEKQTLAGSSKEVLTLLGNSIDRRITGIKRASLAFSGGIDSTILAVLLNRKINLELVALGLEDSFDLANARKVSDELGIPLTEVIVTPTGITKAADEVRKIICSNDRLNTEIAIPFYLLSKKISTKKLFAGQGADELFGGYMRYLKSKHLLDDLDNDVKALSEIVTNREVRVCGTQQVEFFAPYLDIDLVLYALSLPTRFKVHGTNRKVILRKVGELLNLPESVITQNKKAMQYGTGVSKALKKYWKTNAAE